MNIEPRLNKSGNNEKKTNINLSPIKGEINQNEKSMNKCNSQPHIDFYALGKIDLIHKKDLEHFNDRSTLQSNDNRRI